MERAIAQKIVGFVKTVEDVAHKKSDRSQIKNAQLMEEVVALKKE